MDIPKTPPVVRVALFEDQMTGPIVALLESFDAAGIVKVHRADMDGGALFDIPTKSEEHATKLQQDLVAWHLNAVVAPPWKEE